MSHIAFTTMIHPSAKADLEALAKDTPGKSVICANCGASESKEGNKMKKCGACQSIYYCSRKCQVDHWRSHKAECAKSTESFSAGTDATDDLAIKLARRFATNQKLAYQLHLGAIIALDLIASPTPAGASAPALRVRVRTNPADTMAFLKARMSGAEPDMSRVLLHLGPIERANAADVPDVARDLAARMQAQAKAPVVVFLFTSAPSTPDEGDETKEFVSSTWACPMVLNPLALEQVRKQHPIVYISAMFGENKLPLTVENVVSSLNATIHSDKENSTRLRATRK